MEVLGVGHTASWRTRAAYLRDGVELSVFGVAGSGRSTQHDTDAEAQAMALAGSASPAGGSAGG